MTHHPAKPCYIPTPATLGGQQQQWQRDGVHHVWAFVGTMQTSQGTLQHFIHGISLYGASRTRTVTYRHLQPLATPIGRTTTTTANRWSSSCSISDSLVCCKRVDIFQQHYIHGIAQRTRRVSYAYGTRLVRVRDAYRTRTGRSSCADGTRLVRQSTERSTRLAWSMR